MAEEAKVRELVNWRAVELVIDDEPPNPSLIVSGESCYPMEVKLEPQSEVLVAPEYWPIEVVGYYDEAVPEVITPYSVQVSTAMLTRGTKGIELLGKEQSEKVDIPGS